MHLSSFSNVYCTESKATGTEDSRLCRCEMNAVLFFTIQRVFKRPLNEDKAPGGCHRF